MVHGQRVGEGEGGGLGEVESDGGLGLRGGAAEGKGDGEEESGDPYGVLQAERGAGESESGPGAKRKQGDLPERVGEVVEEERHQRVSFAVLSAMRAASAAATALERRSRSFEVRPRVSTSDMTSASVEPANMRLRRSSRAEPVARRRVTAGR